MLYGMDEEDEFEEEHSLTQKSHLNIKKVILFSCIAIAIVAIVISSIVIIKNLNKPTEVNSYSFEDKISNNNSDVVEENNEEPNNQEEEEDDTLYKENAGNDYIPTNTIEENTEGNTENEVVEENTEPKSGVYSGMHMQIPEHNLDVIKNSFVPQYKENSQQLVKNIYFSDEKQVFLTFDDGPTPDVTPRILDILKENEVPATFFVLGKFVEKHPDLVKREYSEGHYIANHGFTHQYSQIYQNKDTVYDEYVRTENAIKNALCNQNYNTYLFRFPGGSSGGKYENIKAEARDLFRSYGVAFTNWNCLSGDAENSKTAEQCLNRIKETKEDNSLIVLMHDANDKEQTVEALPSIIQFFKDEGYTFKNFYEIFK
ncbi:MAG: polysaccharide deacetylase [Clostridia bacterium]|nr:polysaccharide deacetylase [Clostridia bacterium]